MSRSSKNWLDGFKREVRCRMRTDQPLARYTTIGVGGPAELVAWLETEYQLLSATRFLDAQGVSWRVLGGGSNLLVSDLGVPGAVLCLAAQLAAVKVLESNRHEVVVEAGGGVRLAGLLAWVQRRGAGGLSGLIGIPGTVGGAVKMNASTHAGSISDRLTEVRLLRRGRMIWVPASSLGFAYRHSAVGPRQIVVATRFRLPLAGVAAVRREAMAAWRRRLASQPKGVRSAGCFFRNPPQDSAGRLIDLAGCKGERVGAAFVSERHANFLVHRGGATAREILRLAHRVARAVRDHFGVELKREVELWGRFTIPALRRRA